MPSNITTLAPYIVFCRQMLGKKYIVCLSLVIIKLIKGYYLLLIHVCSLYLVLNTDILRVKCSKLQ